MKSKLRLYYYLFPIVTVYLILVSLLFSYIALKAFEDSNFKEAYSVLLFTIVICFIDIFMIYIMRFRCDLVRINKEGIELKKIFCLGKRKFFPFSQFSLFPSWEYSKIGTGQKIIVCVEGKRITELSDSSYSNYEELLKVLEKHTDFQPFIADSYWAQFKQALS
ncbi:MAG: hypothetical protein ACI81T_000979 [Bacteroidia bacterium]|jgi:hypothetical protein